jgi:hypothetical protein
MIDLEREHLLKTYQFCRLGFGILSVALALACFTSLLAVLAIFHPQLVFSIWKSDWYKWIDVPITCGITWGCLIGTTLLWGRWEQVSWQRRSGLLLVMCLIDLGLWFLDRVETVGMGDGGIGHRWLRENLGYALGWAEFALLASLSSDYLVHLGMEPARESGKTARSMAATGAVVWMIFFCERTDWSSWPLHRRMLLGWEAGLLYHAWTLIWAITSVQVTALLFSATRQSGHALEEMHREEDARDLLELGSGSAKGQDLLTVDRDDAF